MNKKRRTVTYKDWITSEGIIKLEGMARDGLINEDIAKKIGIHPSTLYDWQKKYPEISDALKRGKEVVDIEVENALLKNAVGFTETLNKVKVLNDGEIIKYEEETYYPPNTTAQIFWLKNRKPKEWRDKQEVSMTGELSIAERGDKFRKYLKNELEETDSD